MVGDMVNRTDSRARWLDAGLKVLAAEGPTAVRIDRIAAKLKLSKGSFHHHFDGADGFKRDLLDYFESISVEALERAIGEVEAPGDIRMVLSKLTRMVAPDRHEVYWPELELAVRAWATWDPDVRAVQARIDRSRLAALQRVWLPYSPTPEDARTAALLPYLVAIGAAVAVPPVGADELRRVYETLLTLVPEARD